MSRGRACPAFLSLLGVLGTLPAASWARPPGEPLWQEGRGAGRPPLAALVERCRAAVVQIRGQLTGRAGRGSGAQMSVGTGFVISSAGHVVTNEHVVREADDLRVRLHDGRELSACVVGVDGPTDIALLKVSPPRPLPVLPLGDSTQVKAGDDVFVIGNPFGFDHSVTAGILSAKDRIVDRFAPPEPAAGASYAFYLQTDAAINMGNSGGPLLSRGGVVIGVASAFWGGTQPAQGIGFAIPIDVVKRLLPQLAAVGRAVRSWLGVDVQALDPPLAEAFGLTSTQGALLASVQAQSPAALAGLRAGDVVVSWGGHPLTGVEDFKIYAQLTPPGQRVVVNVRRSGRAHMVTLATVAAASPPLAPHPASCQEGGPVQQPPLGLDVQVARGKTPGLLVRTVPAGVARDAGLLPGDVIVQVGAKPVASLGALAEALAPAHAPHAVLVRREQGSFWVALAPHAPAPPPP